ncbi:hypothetical protein KCTCHS21_60980 [Cohnella abietis]|uniref:Uncharacterized protein n=1 Tax=Cohnella abietis TaxID=2507935 RepID=A0A3T1DF23_9BACL|nr:hypothetical protein KCTCHS21_60980 [Cohnella abietis]
MEAAVEDAERSNALKGYGMQRRARANCIGGPRGRLFFRSNATYDLKCCSEKTGFLHYVGEKAIAP